MYVSCTVHFIQLMLGNKIIAPEETWLAAKLSGTQVCAIDLYRYSIHTIIGIRNRVDRYSIKQKNKIHRIKMYK